MSAAFGRQAQRACGPRTPRKPEPPPRARSSCAAIFERRREPRIGAFQHELTGRSAPANLRIGSHRGARFGTRRPRPTGHRSWLARDAVRADPGAWRCSADVQTEAVVASAAGPAAGLVSEISKDRRLGGNRWYTRISAWHRALRVRLGADDRSRPTRRRTPKAACGVSETGPAPRRSQVRNCRD